MVAVYIGTILNKFLTTFTNSVIIPVIDLITPDAIFTENTISKKLESLGFINLRELVRDFLSLSIAITMSYYLIRFVLNVK
jgi:large-conductance mechanosensitive channel